MSEVNNTPAAEAEDSFYSAKSHLQDQVVEIGTLAATA